MSETVLQYVEHLEPYSSSLTDQRQHDSHYSVVLLGDYATRRARS
jgi:hypothetical protein